MNREGDGRSGGCEMVVLHGAREVTVYGCRRILRYGTEEICLAMHRKILCVAGEGLICTSFSGGTITIEGEIGALRYQKKTEA